MRAQGLAVARSGSRLPDRPGECDVVRSHGIARGERAALASRDEGAVNDQAETRALHTEGTQQGMTLRQGTGPRNGWAAGNISPEAKCSGAAYPESTR